MTYITTALKSEAQAVVDKYKLKKRKLDNFTLFENNEITLIISGIGINNMKRATSLLLNNFNILKNDSIINIGICGANKKFEIGKLLEIGSIHYLDKKITLNNNIKNTITCLDSEISEDTFDIVDMESFGFYEATKELKNARIFKVVSDHFQPDLVTKEKTKTLVFNVIEDIIKRSIKK